MRCAVQDRVYGAAPSAALLYLAVLLLFLSPNLVGQSSIATGSVVGTVGDSSGAVIVGAEVTITNSATGQEIRRTTNSAGIYNSGEGLYESSLLLWSPTGKSVAIHAHAKRRIQHLGTTSERGNPASVDELQFRSDF
jgi:hypothetical protein